MKRILSIVASMVYISLAGSPAIAQTPQATKAPSRPPITERIRIKLPSTDTRTSEGRVKVYRITGTNQLLAGDLADGFIGDIAIENDKYRAIIARPDKPQIGTIRGGSIIDIARTAAPVDYISSIETSVDPLSTYTVAIYDKVQSLGILEGTTATVSLTGYVGTPGEPTPQDSERVAVKTTYSSAKGSPLLGIETVFTNNTSTTAWLQPADVIDWGEALVFSENHGYLETTTPVNFVLGTADDFSLGYYAAGNKPLEGYHGGRNSIALAKGAVKNLAAQIAVRKKAFEDNIDLNLQKEYRGYGAQLTPQPGFIMFPGTETRYGRGSDGQPVPQPLYIPAESVRTVDGKTTVTAVNQSGRDIFSMSGGQTESNSVKLAPGASYTFNRFLAVSDSNWATIAQEAYQEKGFETSTLAGAAIENRTGKPIEDVIIRVSGGNGWDGTGRGKPLFQAKTRKDGTFAALVPEGKYALNAVAIGRRQNSQVKPIDVKPGERPKIGVAQLSRESVLRIAISEAETPTSSPLPVKVTIIAKPPFEDVNYGFNKDATKGERNTRYLAQGAAVFPLSPGRYHVVVSRGPEYDILEKEIMVAPEQEVTITGSLPHVMKGLLPPMVSMDTGIMTDASSSGYATAETRAIQAACEGVQVIISGDYGQATDLQEAIHDQGLEKWVKTFVGRRDILHKDNLTADLFVYPLDATTSASYADAIAKSAGLPPDIALSDLKKQFPGLVFEIARPLHPEVGYLKTFPFNKHKKTFPDDFMPPPDFDAIQIVEGKKLGMETENYPRYMGMQLGRLGTKDFLKGSPLSPVGSSDSRLPYGQEIGYPRTYIYLKQNKNLSDVTADDVVSAIRGQHFLVTNGPILLFDALDYNSLEFNITPGEIVDLQTTEIVRIRARVLAAPWITLQGINTRENGVRGITVYGIRPSKEVQRYPTSKVGSNVYTRYLKSDTVLDAYAYSTLKSLAPVVPDAPDDFGGEVFPYCWTAPIFVDRDGDGKIVIKRDE